MVKSLTRTLSAATAGTGANGARAAQARPDLKFRPLGRHDAPA